MANNFHVTTTHGKMSPGLERERPRKSEREPDDQFIAPMPRKNSKGNLDAQTLRDIESRLSKLSDEDFELARVRLEAVCRYYLNSDVCARDLINQFSSSEHDKGALLDGYYPPIFNDSINQNHPETLGRQLFSNEDQARIKHILQQGSAETQVSGIAELFRAPFDMLKTQMQAHSDIKNDLIDAMLVHNKNIKRGVRDVELLVGAHLDSESTIVRKILNAPVLEGIHIGLPLEVQKKLTEKVTRDIIQGQTFEGQVGILRTNLNEADFKSSRESLFTQLISMATRNVSSYEAYRRRLLELQKCLEDPAQKWDGEFSRLFGESSLNDFFKNIKAKLDEIDE